MATVADRGCAVDDASHLLCQGDALLNGLAGAGGPAVEEGFLCFHQDLGRPVDGLINRNFLCLALLHYPGLGPVGMGLAQELPGPDDAGVLDVLYLPIFNLHVDVVAEGAAEGADHIGYHHSSPP
jgi:hypothetical protein